MHTVHALPVLLIIGIPTALLLAGAAYAERRDTRRKAAAARQAAIRASKATEAHAEHLRHIRQPHVYEAHWMPREVAARYVGCRPDGTRAAFTTKAAATAFAVGHPTGQRPDLVTAYRLPRPATARRLDTVA